MEGRIGGSMGTRQLLLIGYSEFCYSSVRLGVPGLLDIVYGNLIVVHVAEFDNISSSLIMRLPLVSQSKI